MSFLGSLCLFLSSLKTTSYVCSFPFFPWLLAVRFTPLPIHVILAWSSNITPKDREPELDRFAREYLANVFLQDRSTQAMTHNSISEQVYKELLEDFLINHWWKFDFAETERRCTQPNQTDRYPPEPAQGFEMREMRLCCFLAKGKSYVANRLFVHTDTAAIITASVPREDLVWNPTENALFQIPPRKDAPLLKHK